jgi:hypothetical protein
MNIGFYGHSNCAYRAEDSLIDIVAGMFSANIVNTGVRQGSEERILLELKKTKNLDLAIIFHSEPQYMFLVDCDRDIGLNSISDARADYLFNKFADEHHKKFVNKFKNSDTFIQSINAYKEFFYNPDLQLNRFYGALIQIDQYLKVKNIPAIHVVMEKTIPTWFNFTSGIVDTKIMHLTKLHLPPKGEWSPNCITKEGNALIADILKGIVEELFPPSPAAVI